jgi:hypothetical protein
MSAKVWRRRSVVVAACIGVWSIVAPADPSAQVIGPNLHISGNIDPQVESQPSVATMGDDVAIVWFRDPGLRTAISRDGGITWSYPIVPRGPAQNIYGRSAVCIDRDGTAFAAALGEDGFAGGYGIFIFAESFHDPKWQWERRTDAVFMPYADAERMDGIRILCDRTRNILYVVYTRRPVRYEGRIQFVRSTDAGASWSEPLELSGSQCNTAQLALGPDGELYVVWEDYAQRAIVGRKSTDQGESFDAPFTVGSIYDNLGLGPPGWRHSLSRSQMLPHMTCMDFPAFLGVAVDTSRGPRRGNTYAVWSEHALGTVNPDPVRVVSEIEPNEHFANATPVQIGDSFGGSMLSADIPPYGDCDRFTFEGTAGTTIEISGAGRVCHLAGPCEDYAKSFYLYCGDDTTQMTLVGCGQGYGPSPIPPLIYTLPTTGRYYLDVGCSAAGSISYGVTLREYLVTPGQPARDHRDVVLVRSTDGGATWSEKVRVNDDPPMYDNSIPAVTVDGSGRVHVAWYDRRDEPTCGARVHTYWTWSEDGGMTFAPSQRVSEQPSDAGFHLSDFNLSTDEVIWQVGDHMALHAEREKVYVLWTYIPFNGDGEIYGAVITDLPTGIAVPRFEGEAVGERVRLRWWVGDGRDVVGFRVHRAVDDRQEFAEVGHVASSGRREHQWEDTAVAAGRRYRYRLEVVRAEGPSSWEGPVEVVIPSRPGPLRWGEAVPNPFDEVVRFGLETGDPAATRVRVFDVTGHLVAELQVEAEGGQLWVRWDGRDHTGRPVPPGIYLARAEVGGRHATRRVIRMR